MINALEGIPRSGKSYECVVYQILPTLARGRKVITNLPLVIPMFAAINPDYADLIELRIRPAPIRGTWDAARVDSKGNGNAFELFADGHVEEAGAEVSLFGHVWDYYSTWKHPQTGQGPVFFIDECHVAMPALGTDKSVVEWYKLHGHFNADVILITQSFRDMNQAIARLIAMLVRVRKADILGKPDEYIRKVHSGYRGAPISTEVRKYKPEFFPLYKSHSQGNSVVEASASDVKPLSVKLKWVTRVWWLLTLIFCIWAFWPKSKPKPPPRPVAALQSTADQPNAPGAPSRPASAAGVAVAAPEPPDLEPLKDKLVHITGWLKTPARQVHTFAVSGSGVVQFAVVSADLVAAGYVWQPLGECMGYLKWKEKTRAITCDAPALAAGKQDAPVVMDSGTGRRSDERQVAHK